MKKNNLFEINKKKDPLNAKIEDYLEYYSTKEWYSYFPTWNMIKLEFKSYWFDGIDEYPSWEDFYIPEFEEYKNIFDDYQYIQTLPTKKIFY